MGAVFKAAVKIEANEVIYNGRGTSTDVVDASIRALLFALRNESACDNAL